MSIMSMSALMSVLRGAGRQHLTASTVAARQAVTGSHVLRIHGYTQVRKTVPTGTGIASTVFSVGGHDWRIKCYPNGEEKETDGEHMSLYVDNLHGPATARFGFSLLDRAGRPSCTRNSDTVLFEGRPWGWEDFANNDELEEGRHLVDDCLTVLCDITVDDHLPLRAAEVAAPLETAAAAPTFDHHLRESLAEAMSSEETADVTVHAGGETFAAHRRVLEAGSPVFKAELEKTATTGELHIADMDAETFKALLCFIYTEALPPSDSNQQVEATMAERLLVAADRYGLENLKRACEKTLCSRVDVDSVAAMVELSERHGCAVLKDACMRFLSCPDNLRLFVSQKRIIEKQLQSLDRCKQN